jgi:hypothetical protein
MIGIFLFMHGPNYWPSGRQRETVSSAPVLPPCREKCGIVEFYVMHGKNTPADGGIERSFLKLYNESRPLGL